MFNRPRRTGGLAARIALSICVALLAVSSAAPGAAQSGRHLGHQVRLLHPADR
jgi:hypothetical protein